MGLESPAMQQDFAAATLMGPSAARRALLAAGYVPLHGEDNTFALCLGHEDDENVWMINLDKETALPYYRMCQKNAHNPYLPSVHEIIEAQDFFVVRLERLVAADHVDIDEALKDDLIVRGAEATAFLSGEGSGKSDLWRDPMAVEAARLIHECARSVYGMSGGKTLPYIDNKPANVFERRGKNGERQCVFGDPLYPSDKSSRHFQENMGFMNRARATFDLPPIHYVRCFVSPVSSLS